MVLTDRAAEGRFETIPVVAALIELGGKLLICQRKEGGAFSLKWEFPGGKVEPGESANAALERELREELGIQAEIGECIGRSVYRYPDGPAVFVEFFRVASFGGEITTHQFHDVRWVSTRELAGYDFLQADLELVRSLAKQS
jgi:8-oxo-dGTP diphosphatase